MSLSEGISIVQNGRPTRPLIAEINALRAATDPPLNAGMVVVDATGKPTRQFMGLLFKILGNAPNANVAIVDPRSGFPTRAFMALVNA